RTTSSSSSRCGPGRPAVRPAACSCPLPALRSQHLAHRQPVGIADGVQHEASSSPTLLRPPGFAEELAHNLKEATMRRDISFKTEDGVVLRGWLYLPDRAAGQVPTIVMAHGFSAVKEMYLDHYAESFTAGGLGALVFDNRNFGASDGRLRQHIDPWE